MGNRYHALGLVAALLLAVGSGCKKSTPAEPSPLSPASAAAASETVARVHWLGKDRLAAETNAAAFMRIWQSPESARLEAQTLEKLSRAPWRLLFGDAQATNAANALLQPLLGDLVSAESYVEVRQPTNQTAELAFAIRLNAQRAKLWETNLAAVMESLTVGRVAQAPGGWQLQLNGGEHSSSPSPQPSPQGEGGASAVGSGIGSQVFKSMQLLRVGEWTVVGLAQDRNNLVSDFASRIGRDRAPFGARATNYWLEANLDLRRLGVALPPGWSAPEFAPVINATAIGDGTNVRTRAELDFPKPLPLVLNPWTVPTNVIQSPLVSFTAVRGIASALPNFVSFSAFPSNSVPDQFYAWDGFRAPFDSSFAFSVNQATNVLEMLAPAIMALVNPRLTRDTGSISMDTNTATLNWVSLPHATPFLQAIAGSGTQFLFGGFAPYAARKAPMPTEMLSHLLEGTNLVVFDWELTGQRLPHWRYLDDIYRILFDLHGPRLMDTASLNWIANNLTNLSFSVTEVRLADKNRLTFARKSTIGLTGFEINMLANWLELPEFPRGLTTLMATNPTPVIKRRRP